MLVWNTTTVDSFTHTTDLNDRVRSESICA